MARWLISRQGEGPDSVHVYYDNLISKMRFAMGALPPETPDQDVVDWIFNYGNPATGDRIQLSDGSIIICMFSDQVGASA